MTYIDPYWSRASHPNPAQDQLFLQWERGDAPTGTCSIVAADGRWLRDTQLQGNTTVIELTGLSSGAYLLRTSTPKGTSVRPFVISAP